MKLRPVRNETTGEQVGWSFWCPELAGKSVPLAPAPESP